jgi:F-type H+-transporting ATPase subunit epsilon
MKLKKEMLDLKIITPQRKVIETKVEKVTCQTIEGEITILSNHSALLTLLKEGIIKVKNDKAEETLFSAGEGYVETDGKRVQILISRAANQDELDEKKIMEARLQAEKILAEQKSASDRPQAWGMLQRTSLDLKIINKLKRK